MAGLRFRFSELIKEARALKSAATKYMANPDVLDSYVSQLQSYMDYGPNRTSKLTFGSEACPLKTTESKGRYEPGEREGKRNVVATISASWTISPLGNRSSKTRAKRELEVCGHAATWVKIFDVANRVNGDDTTPIATWHVDLGAPDAPGCYFHVHLGEGKDGKDGPFPKALPVPRLPTIFVTPMAVVEFVLGELFQSEWPKDCAAAVNVPWHTSQQPRFVELFRWQMGQLKGGTSPWMALKLAPPPPGDLFLPKR